MPQPGHKHKESYQTRHDGIASFTVCIHTDEFPRCWHCGDPTMITVMYHGGKDGIADALLKRYGLPINKTLLKNEKHSLCIGCFGKLERQITHIAEKGAVKGLNAA